MLLKLINVVKCCIICKMESQAEDMLWFKMIYFSMSERYPLYVILNEKCNFAKQTEFILYSICIYYYVYHFDCSSNMRMNSIINYYFQTPMFWY